MSDPRPIGTPGAEGSRAGGAGVSGDDGGRHGVGVARHAPSVERHWDESTVASFRTSAERAAELARRLPDAPVHPAGSFPFVIDYALAKGLAHEAFGHSSEADGFMDPQGRILGWRNELAFAPVDSHPDAPADEWSGSRGVAALYYSQQAVNKPLPPANI